MYGNYINVYDKNIIFFDKNKKEIILWNKK